MSARSPLGIPFSPRAARAVRPGDILAFHRARFGDLRMEDPPAGDPPGGYPTDPPGGASSLEDVIAELGLEPGQIAGRLQASRKWEQRAKDRQDYDTIKAERDRLLADHESEQEKAVREAKDAGRTEAQQENLAATATALLRMCLKGAGVTKSDEIDEIVKHANVLAFLGGDGALDEDAITRFVQRNAGTATSRTWPDTGGGHGGTGTPKAGEAGAAEAIRRFGDPNKK